jgi:transposase-like protein
MQQAPVKVRREFDETFKRESVQHWLQSGQSAEVIAQELGLKANRVYAWKQGFAPLPRGGATAGAKPGSLADLQSRLDAALREKRWQRSRTASARLIWFMATSQTHGRPPRASDCGSNTLPPK